MYNVSTMHTCTLYMYILVHCASCVVAYLGRHVHHVHVSIINFHFLFRINLFYDHCYCLSIECHEQVEDVLDFCRRLMALSNAQEVSSVLLF